MKEPFPPGGGAAAADRPASATAADRAASSAPVADRPAGAPVRPGPAGLGPAELSPAEVGELFALLARGLRAYQLYQANNPVYQRFLAGLRERFAALWERTSALSVEVAEDALVWQGHRFPVGEGRESLAFAFYKDGIRTLTFLPGFEDEVETFLAVLQRARQADAEGDDLVTLLWEQEFAGFQYGYVDVLVEELELPSATGVLPEPVRRDRLEAEVGAPSAAPVAEVGLAEGAASAFDLVGQRDFEETLYFLDEAELQVLQQEVDLEWHRDLKRDVLNALFDRLEDGSPARQLEILGILGQLLPVFLTRGDLRSAAVVLRELGALLERGVLAGQEQRAAADRLFDELSEPALVGQLVRTIEEADVVPEAEELAVFLACLRPAALPTLIRAAGATTAPGRRELLEAAVDRLAAQHPARIVELVSSPDPALAAGSALVAGRLRLAAALPAVARLLERPEPEVRRAAVEALVGLRSAEALQALERALEDTDREVRIGAARGLGALRYQPARPRLEAILRGRRLRAADLTEKLAFFQAYSALGGPESVAFLDRLLNGRVRLWRREPPEIRACAALALGQLSAPAARAALERALRQSEPVVRSAVLRALHAAAGS